MRAALALLGALSHQPKHWAASTDFSYSLSSARFTKISSYSMPIQRNPSTAFAAVRRKRPSPQPKSNKTSLPVSCSNSSATCCPVSFVGLKGAKLIALSSINQTAITLVRVQRRRLVKTDSRQNPAVRLRHVLPLVALLVPYVLYQYVRLMLVAIGGIGGATLRYMLQYYHTVRTTRQRYVRVWRTAIEEDFTFCRLDST